MMAVMEICNKAINSHGVSDGLSFVGIYKPNYAIRV